MSVYYTRNSIIDALTIERTKGKTIGFVPTMGALHQGHLSLVSEALMRAESVVVSIFVNPKQFNNSSDLANYPRMINEDIRLLKEIGNILVFIPEYSDVFPVEDIFEPIDLGGIDTLLEGKFRPGHFQGVVHVLRNLFHIINPNMVFLGQKDFQQVTIVKKMVHKLSLPVEIITCPTKRSSSGLALSSRNFRLTQNEQNEASIIYKTLLLVQKLRKYHAPQEVRAKAIDFISSSNLQLEYLEIIDNETLIPITEWHCNITCCIAAFCGNVRLIDNIQL